MTKCPTCGAVTEAPRLVLSARPDLTPEMQAAQAAVVDAVKASSRHQMERIEAACRDVVAMGLSIASCTREYDAVNMRTTIRHDGDALWSGWWEPWGDGDIGTMLRWTERWLPDESAHEPQRP